MSSYAGYRPTSNYRPYTHQQQQQIARRRLLTPFTAPVKTPLMHLPTGGGIAAPASVGEPDPWLDSWMKNHPPEPPQADTTGGGGQGTTTAPAEQGGGAGAGGDNAKPYEGDPIYQQIADLANKDIKDAEAAALAARQQAVLQFGDPELAKKLGLGQKWEDAAQANP